MKEFQNIVIETEGKDEYEEYLRNVKWRIFQEKSMDDLESEKLTRLPKFAKLSNQLPTWSDLIHEFMQVDINRKETKSWYKLTKRARCCL